MDYNFIMETMELKNVTVKYRYGATACAALNFVLKRGEKLAIVGETASGKSTLLKLISGLVAKNEGEFYIDGKDAETVSVKNRDVLFVQDRLSLFNLRSVRYNLAYPLIIRGEKADEIDAKVISALQYVGLSVNPDKRVYSLTKTEKIKLCYARLFMRSASLYLIDDLYKELEDPDRSELFEKICGWAYNGDKTVVLATENMNDAKKFGNRILMLSYGVQTAEGDISYIEENLTSIWSMKALFPDIEPFEAEIVRNGSDLELVSETMKVMLDETLLLDDVFVGRIVLAAECRGKLFIFDRKSEKVIYPINQ